MNRVEVGQAATYAGQGGVGGGMEPLGSIC